MEKVFKWIGGGIVFIIVAFIVFWVVCEVEYDKTAIEFIQDKLDKQEEVVEDTIIEDDIVVEDENGEVQATASINF